MLFQLQGKGAFSGPARYLTIPQTLRLVIAEEGFRGLYRGNGANCVRIVPTYALKFGCNDLIKNTLRGSSTAPLGFGQLVLAGSLAGLLQAVTTYPLELVYTRLCMSHSMGTYTGISDCFRRVVQSEGPTALYKGFTVSAASSVPFVAMQMTGYEVAKRAAVYLAGDVEGTEPGVGTRMICGSAAGIMAQTSLFPLDTVRKRLQVQGLNGAPRVYNSAWECIKGIAQVEGIRGFYKGCVTNMIRAVPEAAIQFALFDIVRDFLLSSPNPLRI